MLNFDNCINLPYSQVTLSSFKEAYIYECVDGSFTLYFLTVSRDPVPVRLLDHLGKVKQYKTLSSAVAFARGRGCADVRIVFNDYA